LTRPHHAFFRSRALQASLGLLGVLAVGCQSGYTGDHPAKPAANVCGNGTRISSVLGGFYGPAPWVQPANHQSMGCPYPGNVQNNDIVALEYATCLTITAVDRWDETGVGAIGTVYLQDTLPAGTPTPKFAGMSLFEPSYSPPDLHAEPGNVLDVTGNYEEYIGPLSSTGLAFAQCETLPQMVGAASFRFDGTVPEPVVITPADLATYDSARQYLGMLVTVTNVTILDPPATSSGRYTTHVAVPNGSPWQIDNELFDLPTQFPLTMGDTFTSVTGIVTYFLDVHLAPRSVADFHGGNVITDGGVDSGTGGADAGDGG
jgi:hypothetical protein